MRAPNLVPAPLCLLVLAIADARFPGPAIGDFAAQTQPTADRLALVLGDLAADLVEAAVPGDAGAGAWRFVAQCTGNEGIAGPRALAADRPARDFPIFIFLGDAGVGIAERKGRIPADTDRFARLARRDARILDLREAFEPVRKFIRSEEHTSELQSLMRTSYAV